MDFKFFYTQNIFLTPTYDEDWKIISESFQFISQSFKLRKVQEDEKSALNQDLGGFDLLANYEPIYFIDAIEASHKDHKFHLVLLSINSTVEVIRRYEIREQSLVEYEFVALLKLKQDHGHVLMRPEMLADKINEVFRKIEIDIHEEPEFSKNYFVLSDDEDLFKNNIPRKMLNTIGRNKGLYIEIVGDRMLIHLKKGLSKEAIVALVGVTLQILESE